MQIKIKKLKKLIVLNKLNNITEEDYIDYFRFAKIKEDQLFLEAKSPLFVPFYISKEQNDLEQWYINDIDSRLKINDYINNLNAKTIFLIDEFTEKLIFDKTNVKYIVVSSLEETMIKLTNHAIENFNGKTILVTGSVGKTSTVGCLEAIIKDNVLRIYSKRITPVILATYVLNLINKETKYIVMESGLYKKFHVEYYAKILKPYIGVLLNIDNAHLGNLDVETMDDIIISKAKLLIHSKNVIINNNNEYIKKLNFIDNGIYYENSKIGDTKIDKIVKVDTYNSELKPFIKTELSLLINEVVYNVGLLLNINKNILIERINTYKSVENRIIKTKFMDKEIIFDGEVSTVPRLKQLSNHLYEKSILVIRTFTVDGENDYDFSPVEDNFKNFDKVYIFDSVKELNIYKSSNIIIVNDHSFLNNIDNDVKIFYHHGSYFRKDSIPLEDKIV